MTPLANSIFMFFYTFFITFIIAYINDKIIEPKVNQYFPEEINETNEIEENFTELTADENKGLKYAGIGFLVSIGIILLLSLPSGAPLRNPK